MQEVIVLWHVLPLPGSLLGVPLDGGPEGGGDKSTPSAEMAGPLSGLGLLAWFWLFGLRLAGFYDFVLIWVDLAWLGLALV